MAPPIEAQFLDPFRIGLLIALVYTMLRNRAATGTRLPLAAGALFVAVIVPLTVSPTTTQPLWLVVATGLVVNAVWLGVIVTLWRVIATRK